MRDFYDIHSLFQLYGENMNPAVFNQALMATANKRGTEHYLTDMLLIVDEVENSNVMENLWLGLSKEIFLCIEYYLGDNYGVCPNLYVIDSLNLPLLLTLV